MKEISSEFKICVVKDPSLSKKDYIVYILPKDFKKFDDLQTEFAVSDDDYDRIVETANELGFDELEFLTFVYTSEEKSITKKNIIEAFEKSGIKHNKTLEKELREHIKKREEEIKAEILNESDADEIKLPEKGDTVNLCFYLFLDAEVKDNKLVANFSGDFEIKPSVNRNYIKAVESDFELKVIHVNEGNYIFYSKKSQEDFLKEIGLLYKGFVEQVNPGDSDNISELDIFNIKYSFNLLEIKNILSPDFDMDDEEGFSGENVIAFTVNESLYKYMITRSNRIRREKEVEDQKTFPLELILEEAQDLKDTLTNKMNKYADADLFEKAGELKDAIKTIDSKVEQLKSLNLQEVTVGLYNKFFNII
jgi:signal recognition particle subunit SEC65